MNRESVRFLHVSGLIPGGRLHSLPELPQEGREIVHAAPWEVFEHLFQVAEQQSADFLLVTDSPVPADWSLGDETRLRACLEQWRAAGKSVVWTTQTAQSETAAALLGIDGLTVLDHEPGVVLDVSADGRPIASIESDAAGRLHHRTQHERSSHPYRIPRIICLHSEGSHRQDLLSDIHFGEEHSELSQNAVRADDLAADYLVLPADRTGDRSVRRGSRVAAHTPGAVLPWQPEQDGSRGVSLVELRPESAPKINFIAASAVRRIEVSIQVDESSTTDDVVLTAMERLTEWRSERFEKLWIIKWTIRSSEADTRRWSSSKLMRKLERELAELDAPAGPRLIAHEIAVQSDLAMLADRASAESVRQFAQLVRDSSSDDISDPIDSLLGEVRWDPAVERRIRTLLQSVDPNTARSRAGAMAHLLEQEYKAA
ncbi:hypothetical protein [Stratiformator vulcanicus]|uniref:Metallophosphoesterase YhaO n=1 Tax=Stratiformator vulcanicus TaxID=2527980 RepID=A0A517R4J3_9PLAN|nr:hypothetical protein [Stratiformator vulcanicus]QDT38770.1 hypothetical protein Pan189_31680 [Stratiformator vulcanicus]